MQSSNIKALYYITHINNVPSILKKGILSHGRIDIEKVQNTPIYDIEIVNERRKKYTPTGKNLWHYANLFFQPRNAMLDRLVNSKYKQHFKTKQNLAVLGVANTVLQEEGIFITDGNAASKNTRFYSLSAGLDMLHANIEIIQSTSWISWNDDLDLRRKLMAECLVPNQINPENIRRFIVADQDVANSLRDCLSPSNIQKLVVATDIGSNIFTPFN